MEPSSPPEPAPALVDTYYAPAERASAADVQAAAELITQNAVVDHLLQSYGGLLAVLNGQRQILAVNPQLLRMLGVDDAHHVIGLRPGEAIDCDHADDHLGGCGTSRFCSTCGAAIAIVVCQHEGSSAFRECVLDCPIDGRPTTLDLKVHASRIELADQTFVLLYLQDVSADKRRAAVERAFFHDINNLLAGLLGTVEIFADQAPAAQRGVAHQIRSIVLRIAKEIDVQRAMSTDQPGGYQVRPVDCGAHTKVTELRQQLGDHPAARNKTIVVGSIPTGLQVRTDPFLLTRIMTNMLINALEATPRGGTVSIEAGVEGSDRLFTVWNAGHIPDRVAVRVFQRYFSTKVGTGRGVGTYAMKLFAEESLGGTVSFTTDPTEGTRFTLRLPANLPGS
jgi:hypothetical protein